LEDSEDTSNIVWECFRLIEYYNRKDLERRMAAETDSDRKKLIAEQLEDMLMLPDEDTVRQYELNVGVATKKWKEKKDHVEQKLILEIGKMRVIGVQISTSGGDLDAEDDDADL